MESFLTDLFLIFCLILLNGFFAMAEISLVSSRRARLQERAEAGRLGAKVALELHQNSSRFLSTIQVGITLIGILSGAIGEKALSEPLSAWFSQIPFLASYAKGLSTGLTVIVLTYFSVVVGELVPKRLALLAPEAIASAVSAPMNMLARFFYPVSALFSVSSEVLLRFFRAHSGNEPPVSDNEIRLLMAQGAQAGVFHESEQELVSNVMRLDLLPVAEIMTPRHEMAVIDLDDDAGSIRQTIGRAGFSRLVVCRDGVEHIVGVLQSKDLLGKVVAGHVPDAAEIEALVQPPLFVPETVSIIRLMENFRDANTPFALVVDEYGVVQGVVTSTDVMAAIVGDLRAHERYAELDVVRREDGSLLVDGDVSLEKLVAILQLKEDLPGAGENRFYTVGGFLMHALGRVPLPADYVDALGWRFEVMDMEDNRVGKVLVSATGGAAEHG